MGNSSAFDLMAIFNEHKDTGKQKVLFIIAYTHHTNTPLTPELNYKHGGDDTSNRFNV